MWRLLTQKPLVDDPDEPFSAIQTTSRNVPNDRQVRLAVAQLLDSTLRIRKNGILIQTPTTLKTHKPPRVSEARLSLDALDRVVDGITVGLNVLMVRAIEGRDKEMEVDASFWRREQGSEDGGFIFEVVVYVGRR